MNHSDKKIIIQIRKGDIAAYASIVKRYQSMAFSLAHSITKNKEDAEEVTQDAFVKAYRKLDSFKGNSKFSTWLYQIVYRTALSKIRLKKDIYSLTDEKEHSNINHGTYEQNHLERLDKKKMLKQALSKLNEDEGFLLVLYYYQELKTEEISSLTGYSISNVKVKLHRARKNLYSQLQILMNGQAISLIQN